MSHHESFGSRSDPSINGHLHSPNDLDGSLNEDVTDKIRQYHADCNNRPFNDISMTSTSGRLLSEFVLLLFLQWLIGKLTVFFRISACAI